MSKQNFKKM